MVEWDNNLSTLCHLFSPLIDIQRILLCQNRQLLFITLFYDILKFGVLRCHTPALSLHRPSLVKPSAPQWVSVAAGGQPKDKHFLLQSLPGNQTPSKRLEVLPFGWSWGNVTYCPALLSLIQVFRHFLSLPQALQEVFLYWRRCKYPRGPESELHYWYDSDSITQTIVCNQ